MKYRLAPADQTIEEGLDAFFYGVSQPSRNHQRQMDRAIRREFARNFSRQGSDGGSWAALADATVLDRIRQGYPGHRPILIRSGDYAASFTSANNEDHVLIFKRTGGGFELEVGSQDYRAGWLEYGTGRMPARPVADLDGRAEGNILDEVERIHDELFRRNVGD